MSVLIPLLLGASLAADPTPATPSDTPPPSAEPAASSAPHEVAPPPPNILIVLADDISTHSIAAYHESPDVPTTPILDKIAANGIVFRNGYVNPVCSPTRSALLTGRYCDRWGIGWYLAFGKDNLELPIDAMSLPAMLDQAPQHWSTAALGKWHLTTRLGTGTTHPNKVGFDYYAGAMGNPNSSLTKAKNGKLSYYHWEKTTNGKAEIVDTYMTTDTANETIGQIQSLPQPWMIYVPFNAAHVPTHVPPKKLVHRSVNGKSSKREKYLAAIEAMDTELGRIMDVVPDNTLVIFIGDNGTPKGSVPDGWDSKKSKGTVYEGGTNVPFIVSGPMITDPGRVSDALVHVVDVYPTVAELAGITSPKMGDGSPVPVDGISLVPYFSHPDQASLHNTIYTAAFKSVGPPPYDLHLAAMRGPRYKVMRVNNTVHFFDLEGRFDDGPDLLKAGPLNAEQQAAYDRLLAELDHTVADVTLPEKR